MGKVINLATGSELMTPELLLRYLLEKMDDIKHLVVVVARTDDMGEVYWSRQPITELSFAAARLNSLATDMARTTIDD